MVKILDQIAKKLDVFTENRRKDFVNQAVEFLRNNKKALVIIADPASDVVVIGHGDSVVSTRINPIKGHTHRMVKDVLSRVNFEKRITTFLNVIDGALFNFANPNNKLKYEKENKDVSKDSNQDANQEVKVGI